jgi:endonuclease YncB( thermonuclease family)
MLHPYSEPNVGTTFKVYLAVAPERTDSVRARPVPVPTRGHERILMPEDDAESAACGAQGATALRRALLLGASTVFVAGLR